MTPFAHHYLNASAQDGCFHNTGGHPSNPAQVDALFEYLQQNKVPKLVLHFHGGLVPENEGITIAKDMVKGYGDNSHVISIIWDTGLLRSLVERFDLIEKTTLFKKLRDVVVKKVYQKLGIEEGAKGPIPIEDNQIQVEIKSEQPFQPFDATARNKAQGWDAAKIEASEAAIEGELEVEIDVNHPLVVTVKEDGPQDEFYKNDHLIPETNTEEGAKGVLPLALIKPLATVIIRVIKRFLKNSDHDFYPTVVEEILREFYVAELGKEVWDVMKQKAASLWEDNKLRTGDDQHAGRYLLDALAQHKAKNPDFTVDVVGHSAGSIAICHLLRCMAENYPSLLPLRHVIFLAPACRSDLFVTEMVDQPSRFKHFRMFTMDADHEKKDNCVRYIYTHSLLYLISGVLETGTDDYILGLQKQLLGEKPYKDIAILIKIREFLAQDNRLVLSPSPSGANPGFECASLRHSDFDNDPATLRSLLALVKQ